MKHIIVKGDTARELATRYPDLVVGRKEHPMPTYKHPIAVALIKAALGFAAGAQACGDSLRCHGPCPRPKWAIDR